MQQQNKNTEIIFRCPFCEKEITEDEGEETMIGNSDNIDTLDFAGKEFTVFHVKCYEESKKNE